MSRTPARDLSFSIRGGLRPRATRELATDSNHAGLEIDLSPLDSEEFLDAHSRVDIRSDQDAISIGRMFE